MSDSILICEIHFIIHIEFFLEFSYYISILCFYFHDSSNHSRCFNVVVFYESYETLTLNHRLLNSRRVESYINIYYIYKMLLFSIFLQEEVISTLKVHMRKQALCLFWNWNDSSLCPAIVGIIFFCTPDPEHGSYIR